MIFALIGYCGRRLVLLSGNSTATGVSPGRGLVSFLRNVEVNRR
jgi:hypothetical protein